MEYFSRDLGVSSFRTIEQADGGWSLELEIPAKGENSQYRILFGSAYSSLQCDPKTLRAAWYSLEPAEKGYWCLVIHAGFLEPSAQYFVEFPFQNATFFISVKTALDGSPRVLSPSPSSATAPASEVAPTEEVAPDQPPVTPGPEGARLLDNPVLFRAAGGALLLLFMIFLIIGLNKMTPRRATVQKSPGGSNQSAQDVQVNLTSDPPGASVFRGTSLLGATPITIKGILNAEETLVLKKKGYFNYKASISYKSGAHSSVRMTRHKVVVLTIRSSPSGARVKMNGKLIGTTPLKVVGGNSKDNLWTWRTEFTVKKKKFVKTLDGLFNEQPASKVTLAVGKEGYNAMQGKVVLRQQTVDWALKPKPAPPGAISRHSSPPPPSSQRPPRPPPPLPPSRPIEKPDEW